MLIVVPVKNSARIAAQMPNGTVSKTTTALVTLSNCATRTRKTINSAIA
jgi:hypothetical protein